MKVLCLISNGIDSPVAAYVMSQVGAELVLLHMDNRPYADDGAIEVVKMNAARLREVTGQPVPLYVASHGPTQASIRDSCDPGYQCVMCKRAMQRTARELARRLGCVGIVMGDSLGQVASQTLRNIKFENHDLDFPVLRPLIGLDKLEIVDISERIGTYGISITPVCGCSLVPQRPITEASLVKLQGYDEASNLRENYERAAEEAVLI